MILSGALIVAVNPTAAQAASPTAVINEVYGGGPHHGYRGRRDSRVPGGPRELRVRASDHDPQVVQVTIR
jgi:hypothetical protein